MGTNNAKRYLIVNHPTDVNIKTVLAYEFPPTPPTPGLLHWTGLCTGDLAFGAPAGSGANNNTVDNTFTNVGTNTATVSFAWEGASTPILSDFVVTTGSWLTITAISAVGTGDPGTGTGSVPSSTGYVTLSTSSNVGGSARNTTMTVGSGFDLTSGDFVPGQERYTMSQPGDYISPPSGPK
tara:strand:- start:756 stop:1298 length:543 start_codon:yes stop_codon:yes gene_type:complete